MITHGVVNTNLTAKSLNSSDGSEPEEVMIRMGSDAIVSLSKCFKLNAGGESSLKLRVFITKVSMALTRRSGFKA